MSALDSSWGFKTDLTYHNPAGLRHSGRFVTAAQEFQPPAWHVMPPFLLPVLGKCRADPEANGGEEVQHPSTMQCPT